MTESQGVSKYYIPLIWATVTTASSLAIVSIASRYFEQVAKYQRWGMGASILPGIGAYWLTRPIFDTTREYCDRFEEALKRKAAPRELIAHLKQVLFSLSCLKELPEIDMLKHLVKDKQPTSLAQAIMQDEKLNGEIPIEWQEALKEGPCADLSIHNSLAGYTIHNRDITTCHTGTLVFKGNMQDLTQMNTVFKATGLIIESEKLPDLVWIEERFPKLKHLEICGLQELVVDGPLPLMEKMHFPQLRSLTIKGNWKKTPSFLFTAPLLEELVLSKATFKVPFSYLPLLKTLELIQEASADTLVTSCPFLKSYQAGGKIVSLEHKQAQALQFSPFCHYFTPTPEQLGNLLVSYPLAEVPKAWQNITSLSLEISDVEAIQALLIRLPNLRKVTFKNGAISTDILYSLDWKIITVEFPNGASIGNKKGPLDPALLAQVCHLAPFKNDISSFYEGPLTASVLFQIPASKKGGVKGLFNPDQTTIDPVSSALWLANGNYRGLKKCNTSKITTLLIEDIQTLKDDDLVAFIQCFPSVKTISLQRCPQITSTAIQKLLEWWLPSLNAKAPGNLNLTGCKSLDDTCLYSIQNSTEFNLTNLQLVIDETPLSTEARKDLLQQKKALNGENRTNLLNDRLPAEIKDENYDRILEWYKQKKEGILNTTQADISREAKEAYLEIFHTDHFPLNVSVKTLIEAYSYAKTHAPDIAKRAELLLSHQITETNVYETYTFAKREKLPALKWAVMAYMTANASMHCYILMEKRIDPMSEEWDDFTITPYIPGSNEDIPFGKELKFQKLALQEGKEYQLVLQPGFSLWIGKGYGQSDKAYIDEDALSCFKDYLYKGKTETPLDVDLAYDVYGLATRGGFQRIRDKMTAWAREYQRNITQFNSVINDKIGDMINQL